MESIENFLDGYDKDNNDKICVNLKDKIKDNNKKLNERNETEKKNIILNKYASSNSEDSYTRIYESKSNNSKLLPILEFLFFLRDKAIDIFHSLNDNGILIMPRW